MPVSNSPRELFHLGAIEKLRVYVAVPETYSRAARPGATTDLTLDEFPGQVFHGALVRNSSSFDVASRTLLVGFWAIGPTALQAVFDAGRRKATSRAAHSAYDATVAEYRQSALTAFQEVEDNLAAVRILEQEAQQQQQATASAQESLQIFNDRYIGGADPSCK